MKDDLLYSESKKINRKFLRDSLSEKVTKIKNSINYRLRVFNSKEKENLTLESVKKQYEELKAKKEEFEKYEDDLLKYDDELKDMDYCLIKSNDLNSVINCKKNSLSQRFFKYINIKLESKATNALMFFNKESIIKIEEVINKLDRDEILIEKTYKLNRLNIEKICDLYISYEEKKYVIKNIEPFDKKILGTLSEIVNVYEEYHLQNKEIRDNFIKAFSDAKYELNIASPWMNNYVVNDELINKMEKLLIRGGIVKIIYGIEENNSFSNFKKENNNKNRNSDRIAEKLKEKFKCYNDNFKIKKVNSHNKLLICDESYYIETSFNLLSFSGEYDENSNDTRDEGATYSTNIEVIKDLRNRYFDF
ncbi:hypothetical protein CLPUN_40720 [Clostridium puniceum]|uniref:Phospholipase D-like domain-containing protein n=1 Tax=Clostridium puniceum TaxID=29367 RepID=A0A1S8T8T6_9CLOT|nr:phospholipase D-like domain-containing protein [Clostridium puniceum]OOM74190.1 hypothetical protein CLPUN_40720 [Clostridium puniceum]